MENSGKQNPKMGFKSPPEQRRKFGKLQFATNLINRARPRCKFGTQLFWNPQHQILQEVVQRDWDDFNRASHRRIRFRLIAAWQIALRDLAFVRVRPAGQSLTFSTEHLLARGQHPKKMSDHTVCILEHFHCLLFVQYVLGDDLESWTC